ncbi:TPA: LPXTG cell wall anchor domain-containing protein, partial [Streptococcus suis]
ESLPLPADSSVTDLVARLPQPAQGHYEIASSFDQTQLNNLQTSQTIEIPLELVTPALPVTVFDKTAVTGLEVVTPPTKATYRPSETVDLSGLQVKLVDNQGLSRTISSDQFGEYGVDLVSVTLTPQVTSLQVRKDNLELIIPIQVIPWKADVYAVTVGDKYVYETDDDLAAVENAVLAKVQIDAQAGSVEKSLVNPLPTTLGEHSLPVLVRFDDGSQKRVSIQVIVQKTAHGNGVTHDLPEGVLPPLETAKGDGVTHELPIGVLLPLETAKGDGVTHDLPIGVLPALVTSKGDGVTHELPIGVLPPLETAKGEGVTHDLPAGVLPPLETAKGESLSFDRPILTVDKLVKRLTSGQSVPQGILVVSENNRGENSPKPVAKEMAVSEGVVRQRKLTNEQLPKTGDRNSNLTLLGILFAMCQFIFLNVRSKSYLARFTNRKK